MVRSHGSGIKDPERYEKLRDEGMSKEKAARIANTPRREAGKRGGQAPDYEARTKNELLGRAKELGLRVNSKMKKQELIDALRQH